MTATEKVLTAALKDIDTALHTIDIRSASRSPKEYSIVKANYFYDKVGENIKEWLAKIDQMIEANNVIMRIRVVVTAAYLRNIATNWYEADKTNINQYLNKNNISFISQIKVWFTSDA